MTKKCKRLGMNRRVMSVAVAVILICISAFTMCGVCQAEEKSVVSVKAEATKVNNTVCPVMDDKIDMNNPVTVEYKGETYNLCCPMCIAEFNRGPDEYSAKAKK